MRILAFDILPFKVIFIVLWFFLLSRANLEAPSESEEKHDWSLVHPGWNYNSLRAKHLQHILSASTKFCFGPFYHGKQGFECKRQASASPNWEWVEVGGKHRPHGKQPIIWGVKGQTEYHQIMLWRSVVLLPSNPWIIFLYSRSVSLDILIDTQIGWNKLKSNQMRQGLSNMKLVFQMYQKEKPPNSSSYSLSSDSTSRRCKQPS